MTQIKIYLGMLILCIVGGFAWLQFNKVEYKEHQESIPRPPLNAEKLSLSNEELSPINWGLETRKNIESGSSQDFAQRLKALDRDELAKIASEIYKAIEEHPEETTAWLEEVSLALAESDHHGQAAQLLDLLMFPTQIPAIERKIFKLWLEKDSQQAFSSLEEAAQSGVIRDHQLSLLASMVQNESIEQLDQFVEWIKKNENPLLKGTAIHKLVTHLDPENVDLVAGIISRNIDSGPVSAALFDFVSKHSPEDRVKTLDWVSELPTDNLGFKAQVFGRVINTIAIENVDQAAELLSADHFLSNYYHPPAHEPDVLLNGEWSGSAQRFFDIALQSFIDGAMFTDMELARNSAHSFFDPQLSKDHLQFLDEHLGETKPGGHSCEFCSDAGHL